MQSLDKVKAKLSELQAPPGADVDGLELTLRSIVAMVGPRMEAELSAMEPANIDQALEAIAIWFLNMRGDGAQPSAEFLHAIGQLITVDATAEEIEADSAAELGAAPAAAEPAPAAPAAPAPAVASDAPPASEPAPGDESAPGSAGTDAPQPPPPAADEQPAAGSTPPPAAPPWG